MKKITLILLLISFNVFAWDFNTKETKNPEYTLLLKNMSIYYADNKEIYCDYTLVDNNALVIVNQKYTNFDDLIVKLTKKCNSDLEKARSFYVYLTHTIKYDLSTTGKIDENGNLYGIKPHEFLLKNKKGVCLDISITFKKMCDKANIKSEVICGWSKYENNIKYQHAWNIFKFNDKYYIVDVTWGLQTFEGDNRGNYELNFCSNPYYFSTSRLGNNIYIIDGYQQDGYKTFRPDCFYNTESQNFYKNNLVIYKENWDKINVYDCSLVKNELLSTMISTKIIKNETQIKKLKREIEIELGWSKSITNKKQKQKCLLKISRLKEHLKYLENDKV